MQKHPASYRDPSGFIFVHEGILYRQVNQAFREDFEHFEKSGFSRHLIDKGFLVPHKIIPQNFTGSADWHTTLQPEPLSFISYPWEWSFDMLRDAALLTLQLAKEAMDYGMMLKDATPFNVQLQQGKMVFIDTLSFERYQPENPWVAYRQFCENFLAPLALMHYLKTPLQSLLLAHPDGLELGMVKKMLPLKSRFHLGVALHLHLQANYATGSARGGQKKVSFSAQKLKNILSSLEQAVRSFSLDTPSGVWSGYYEEALQRPGYVAHKKGIIEQWLQALPGLKTAVDIGANEGAFSLLLAENGLEVLAADFDHFSVNNLYKKIQASGQTRIHPLIANFVNPSPAIGVNNAERPSLLQRMHTDLVLALAVIHHLALGKHVPFEQIAPMMAGMGHTLILEFVPADDEKSRLLLQNKTIEFPWYNRQHFEKVFSSYFTILKTETIAETNRILYLMKKKDDAA